MGSRRSVKHAEHRAPAISPICALIKHTPFQLTPSDLTKVTLRELNRCLSAELGYVAISKIYFDWLEVQRHSKLHPDFWGWKSTINDAVRGLKRRGLKMDDLTKQLLIWRASHLAIEGERGTSRSILDLKDLKHAWSQFIMAANVPSLDMRSRCSHPSMKVVLQITCYKLTLARLSPLGYQHQP